MMINQTNTTDIILNQAIEDNNLLADDGVILLMQTDENVISNIRQTADELRQKQVGDTVTYVINRNINFTNICEQHCNFCAFRRDEGDQDSFWLTIPQIIEKAADAVEKKATEICMQGGLHPQAKLKGTSLNYYLKLVTTLKAEFPQLHLHAFSPQEVQFIAREDGISYADVIIARSE
ncbi:MAG TPA: 7,8-didemethyl-8-hydroxy-5-deazariboflavin synthase subunit CofH, partial [Cyanothece sp. UBA12306]|nr:7,8-didemethyl-8-hydroxy-5-deazariboflavin synthase subunit CofH [Cyanothece sp. UBA12306]